MKGPFQRLKHDLRRKWECPECHHHEHTSGHVTNMICRCQRELPLQEQKFMRLFEPPAATGLGVRTGAASPAADSVPTMIVANGAVPASCVAVEVPQTVSIDAPLTTAPETSPEQPSS